LSLISELEAFWAEEEELTSGEKGTLGFKLLSLVGAACGSCFGFGVIVTIGSGSWLG